MSKSTQFARHLRSNPTDAETHISRHINRDQLGIKFRRQQSIGPYIVDFFCPALKLIIEVDGGQHTELADAKRDKWLMA